MPLMFAGLSVTKQKTKIKFTDEFESQNWVLKADILKDAISDLTDKYDQILKDEK